MTNARTIWQNVIAQLLSHFVLLSPAMFATYANHCTRFEPLFPIKSDGSIACEAKSTKCCWLNLHRNHTARQQITRHICIFLISVFPFIWMVQFWMRMWNRQVEASTHLIEWILIMNVRWHTWTNARLYDDKAESNCLTKVQGTRLHAGRGGGRVNDIFSCACVCGLTWQRRCCDIRAKRFYIDESSVRLMTILFAKIVTSFRSGSDTINV